MAFDKSWEKNKYAKIKKLDFFPYEKGNRYPYDLLVSIVAKKFFATPKDQREDVKMLDLGCGTGNNAKFLAENGFDVFGIDGSESAIKICKEKFEKLSLKGNFIAGDLAKLPYKDDFFDLTVDRESVYCNTYADIEKIIGQVYSKLKKGGIFLSFMFGAGHSNKKFGTEVESNTFNNFKEGSCFYKTGIAHFTTEQEIDNLFAKFQLENVMKHSLTIVSGKPDVEMEFEEFIIIAKK